MKPVLKGMLFLAFVELNSSQGIQNDIILAQVDCDIRASPLPVLHATNLAVITHISLLCCPN